MVPDDPQKRLRQLLPSSGSIGLSNDGTLSYGDSKVKLRDQVMKLLVFLLEQRGQGPNDLIQLKKAISGNDSMRPEDRMPIQKAISDLNACFKVFLPEQKIVQSVGRGKALQYEINWAAWDGLASLQSAPKEGGLLPGSFLKMNHVPHRIRRNELLLIAGPPPTHWMDDFQRWVKLNCSNEVQCRIHFNKETESQLRRGFVNQKELLFVPLEVPMPFRHFVILFADNINDAELWGYIPSTGKYFLTLDGREAVVFANFILPRKPVSSESFPAEAERQAP